MARCVCGYTHAHIQHECWAPKPKHGQRMETGPRCPGCNTLHAHIEHVCPKLEAQKQALVMGKAPPPTFVEEPQTEALALAQWAQGWRPKNMCKDCPSDPPFAKPCKACWVRAGYKEEHYFTASEL